MLTFTLVLLSLGGGQLTSLHWAAAHAHNHPTHALTLSLMLTSLGVTRGQATSLHWAAAHHAHPARGRGVEDAFNQLLLLMHQLHSQQNLLRAEVSTGGKLRATQSRRTCISFHKQSLWIGETQPCATCFLYQGFGKATASLKSVPPSRVFHVFQTDSVVILNLQVVRKSEEN